MARAIVTLASVQNILNSRATITEAMEGTSTIVTVRGAGNIIDVKDKAGNAVPAADGSGVQLQKKIFNVVCNSAVAIKNARNQATLREGYAAEKAGDSEKAGELYNTYLNRTQVSISVLSTSSLFGKISDGDELRGKVQVIKTENGTLLTLDPKSLAIKETSYAPVVKINLMDMAVAEETADPAAEVAETADIAAVVTS